MTQENKTSTNIHYRVCSASGTYPAQPVITNHSALFIDEQLIVIAWDSPQENAEAILNASLILATENKSGFLKLYGLPFVHQMEAEFSENLLSEIKEDIEHKISSHYAAPGEVLPEFDCYQNAKGASLPLMFSGLPYSMMDDLINPQDFEQIHSALSQNPSTELLGLCERLIVSSKLSCHFQFQAEANHYLLQSIERYLELEWAKKHPLMLELQQQATEKGCYSVAKDMTPIDYIKTYRVLVSAIRHGFLATL